MKKSKSFTQFKGNGFAISICIDNNGTFRNKSVLVLYGKKRTKYTKQYNEDNKEKRIEYKKQYDKDNRVEIAVKAKQYKQDHKVEIAIKSKQYYSEHKEEAKLYTKRYRKNNKEELALYGKQYRKDNPGKVRKYKYKRRGWGTPKPINKYFEFSHLHHLHLNNDYKIAIYIPTDLHKSVWHAHNKPETMAIINKLAFEWLATQDIII